MKSNLKQGKWQVVSSISAAPLSGEGRFILPKIKQSFIQILIMNLFSMDEMEVLLNLILIKGDVS